MMQPEPSCNAAPPALPADLAHLFRHALREGRIHPLMPLVLRYRQEQALAQAQERKQAGEQTQESAHAAAATAKPGPAP